MTRRTVAAGALLVGLALPAPAGALTLKPCLSTVLPRLGAQCGSLAVPLDQSGRVPGTLRLHIERIPARGTSRGALFVLEGGPGGSVTASRQDYAVAFHRQLADRDLVLVDQRGTGLSGALRCPKLKIPDSAPALGQADLAAACATRLGAAAHFYTTPSTWSARHSGSTRSRFTEAPTARSSRSPTASCTRPMSSAWCSTRSSHSTRTRSTSTPSGR